MKKQVKSSFILFSLLLLTSCGSSKGKQTFTHAFSLSEDTQVYFAPGNLEYCPATSSWRFAENVYKARGLENENIADDYTGYLDLFGWGATGLADVKVTESVEDNFSYAPEHKDLTGTNYDFSKVIDGDYRMFSHTEIHYLLMYRDNAEKLFGYGTIEGNCGLFILPDDWVCPKTIRFTPSTEVGFTNQYNWYYSIGEKENYQNNQFSESEWKQIQSAGGVFLPVTGIRYGKECDHVGLSGHYWTSSYYGEEFANCLCLFEKDLFLEGNFDRYCGLAVRLVKEAQQKD